MGNCNSSKKKDIKSSRERQPSTTNETNDEPSNVNMVPRHQSQNQHNGSILGNEISNSTRSYFKEEDELKRIVEQTTKGFVQVFQSPQISTFWEERSIRSNSIAVANPDGQNEHDEVLFSFPLDDPSNNPIKLFSDMGVSASNDLAQLVNVHTEFQKGIKNITVSTENIQPLIAHFTEVQLKDDTYDDEDG
eukprot:CAMPEP_0117427032 /NCGR_PEP_ID=MMETSP0758-20121206/6985_1 /TAXON_ID=63605 /ORGANISM="Percolomonas cosmopolitus, Strain AE-1 (ATCC 50343)" /LENGTH=190 /DNA_ID=CAMNT_0005212473 /DNA_START=169 /DNA_END=738 /DNA_ORIENTATION=+